MKAKRLLMALCTALAIAFCVAFAACDTKEPEPKPETPVEYTVTFDANGGTLTGNATVKVEKGKTVTGAPTASKDNHDFSGWYTLATDGDKVELATYKVEKDVTLYAHYTEKTVTPPPAAKVKVTFNANGGVLEGESVVEVDDDGVVLDPPMATKEGYRFDDWYSAADGGEVVDYMFTPFEKDTTVYAHWIKTYVVTFNANEGVIAGAETVTVDEGGSIKGAPTASKTGLEFHGWYTMATGGEAVDLETYVVTKDVTLYARYGVLTMPMKLLKNHEGTAVGYRIEAEDAKAEGTQNSDNQAHPGEFLEDVPNASGGHSLGYLGKIGNTVTFTFNASAAGKANLSFMASSAELFMDFSSGFTMYPVDMTVNSSVVKITLNGTPVTFSDAKLRGTYENMVFNKYWDPIDLGEVDLVEGLNMVKLEVLVDKSPNLDCLDIQTSLTLTSANGAAAKGEASLPKPPTPDVVYDKNVAVKLIVGGYEGGPAVEKAILTFVDDIPATAVAESNPFAVVWGGNLGGKTDKVYLCDATGAKLAESATASKYVAIEYAVSYGQWSFNGNLSPFTYNQQTSKNLWKDISTVTVALNELTIGETTYTKFGGTVTATKEIPCLTDWKLDGTYTDTIQWGTPAADRTINLTYGAYEPEALKTDSGKNALIVWLHGGGEGGTDPTIAILGNQVTGLSSDTVQKYFKANGLAGAYVLAPQTPTQWMDIGDGKQASSPENSVYTESLFKLIQKYVTEHDDVDANRIYLGGCSNGGWMTLELLADHGEYFAAAYPVSACYDTQYITDAMINKLKDIPIWFTHSKADATLPICETEFTPWNPEHPEWGGQSVLKGLTEKNTNELYIKLVNAGATNVYYSLFENVKVGNTTYDGHWSWIYTFRDECRTVQTHTGTGESGALVIGDLNPASTATVTLTEGGEAVTMWAWLAAQAKTPAATE